MKNISEHIQHFLQMKCATWTYEIQGPFKKNPNTFSQSDSLAHFSGW